MNDMDYNELPLSIGVLGLENQMKEDRFYNMTDDEKKEYLERNRSVLSKDEIERMSAAIIEEDETPKER